MCGIAGFSDFSIDYTAAPDKWPREQDTVTHVKMEDLSIPEEVKESFTSVLKCGIYNALYAEKLLTDRELELLCSNKQW